MVESCPCLRPGRASEIYRSGAFELSARTGELRKNGLRLKLQDQPVRILILLLENAGEVVTREQIQKRLWADDVHVDYENAINSAVRKLREALIDTSDNPRFVETLARRGYRFVAPVTRAQNGDAVTETVPVELPVDPPKPRRWAPILAIALAGALAIVAGTLWVHLRTESEAPPLKAVPLTSYPGYESGPSFSPDGKQVAFFWKGERDDNYDIYVQLIGSGRPLRLTTDPARDLFPSWSPDGQSLAFVRWDSGNKVSFLQVPALGGAEREVAQWGTTPFVPYIGGWTPDGRSLVVSVKDGDKPYSLFLLSMESGEKRRLSSPPEGTGGDVRCSISPDGRTLAFVRLPTSAGFPSDVYTVGLTPGFTANGDAKRLTFFSAPNIGGIAWTVDSREIVFSAINGGPIGLWRMPVSGSEKPRRLAVGENAFTLAISLRANRLIYEQQIPADFNILRLDLTDPTAPPHPLIASTRLDQSAQYSPDGRRIAFVSDRSGPREIWACDADGSNEVQLTALGGLAGSPSWSLDSRHIAFDASVADRWQTFVMDSHGGQPRQLTSGPAENARPVWSHDGRSIWFESTRSGQDEVWKMTTVGGKAVQVTKHGGRNPQESEDGTAIYYNSGNSIMTAAPDGSGETKVIDDVGAPINLLFVLTHDGIYYWGLPGPQLRFFSFASGQSRNIMPAPKPSILGLSVSPDGHWLIYTQLDNQPGSDLMLVENFH